MIKNNSKKKPDYLIIALVTAIVIIFGCVGWMLTLPDNTDRAQPNATPITR
jgi:hypothetical protein